MTGIILPNGQQVSGGMYAFTLCLQGSKLNNSGQPDVLTKYVGIMVELPKMGPEELNNLLTSARTILEQDRDFAAHQKDVEGYLGYITIAWMQKLD